MITYPGFLICPDGHINITSGKHCYSCGRNVGEIPQSSIRMFAVLGQEMHREDFILASGDSILRNLGNAIEWLNVNLDIFKQFRKVIIIEFDLIASFYQNDYEDVITTITLRWMTLRDGFPTVSKQMLQMGISVNKETFVFEDIQYDTTSL